MMKNYDVLFIGNYTKDTIISPAGMKHVDGGAVNYAAHAAGRLGLSVAVVTRLAKEDDRVVERLVQTGIDCYPTYTAQSMLMTLEYPTSDPDIRMPSVTATAGSITAGEVETLNAKAAVIGSSLRGEVGLDVIEKLKEKNMLVAAASLSGYLGAAVTSLKMEKLEPFNCSMDEESPRFGANRPSQSTKEYKQ